MKKRNWFLFLLLSAFVLALAACQQADPKGSYAAAYKKLLAADSYEFSSDIGLKVNATNLGAEDKQIADMLNNANITISGKTDAKTKQSEAVIKAQLKVQNMSFDFDIPVYMDEKKQVGYIKIDSVLDSFGIFLGTAGMNFDSVKGKYLEFPLDEDKSSSKDTEEIQKQVMESIQKAADNLPADKFEKSDLTDKEKEQGAKQKVAFSFSDKEIKAAVVKFIEIAGEATGEAVPKKELDNIKDGLKDVTFKKFDVTSTIDDKENLLTENADISLAVDSEKAPQSFGITTSTTYKNIDGDVTFDHKPKKEDIVTEDELQSLMAADTMNF
ncbi:hypothetical protein [Bacillus swezeyi]|uniref:Lipoprotein n=1 Tax=Bacillus swezeyi TaxID=1925020 RepID=A0A5M8RVF4_9BACI|nr:hypothetical protein [Bacillus swezeyi]KAA6451859.1 hypothetical protein DX927_14210 [Bacillus swezeyi]TYS36082.1 hypothetical protein FZC77_13670 [Bacillus swezeyi]